jgi:hypothetical protein
MGEHASWTMWLAEMDGSALVRTRRPIDLKGKLGLPQYLADQRVGAMKDDGTARGTHSAPPEGSEEIEEG